MGKTDNPQRVIDKLVRWADVLESRGKDAGLLRATITLLLEQRRLIKYYQQDLQQ